MSGIVVLGSTGSIGLSTLDVLARHADRYRVVALAANSDVDRLFAQCLQFRPALAAMADTDAAARLAERLREAAPEIEVLGGAEGVIRAAEHPDADQVMAAIVGAAGLQPALAAVRAGKRILLANKEALVVAGALFMQEVHAHGAEILPIDSEHNAIFQCMPPNFREGLDRAGVRRILLTASGGPFRTRPAAELAQVTPEEACAHPNWDMGRKISVDSATLMNKGLEVIEARWLFEAEPERIEVVVHPQSVIHSLVEYVDGSVLAQLGNPDMRTPIAHALAWPERQASGVAPLDLFAVARLDFEPPDLERFPCLRLAFDAVRAGGVAPAVLNAANEVAVAHFLDHHLGFTEIPRLIEDTLAQVTAGDIDSLEGLMAVDAEARRVAERLVADRV
ncbi:1-deoxy-D-xylulose-5-phosphate reductoisomerase [endosymbiont of unidentified scaly snail isolate Monju]|uniref:1-deoxy-D-xylulose-5-phosphate reductoisomerase n=1 Tax=endosymbiont of unidentified scaly snail isolate Monju TaxID=1248727 RepID=UPI000389244A|nr:1-deoxy-D-xylulose-5-phosphate reductoisomerase [endosymbiont of unidentified scaly snail isolate Monju]BAN68670.1 1-deoxy-D-xylulose-5-phosphate reductoisomerase [endosymbiont of unidentified scaly snail isolate Monju]